jgi:hypothetical protein
MKAILLDPKTVSNSNISSKSNKNWNGIDPYEFLSSSFPLMRSDVVQSLPSYMQNQVHWFW